MMKIRTYSTSTEIRSNCSKWTMKDSARKMRNWSRIRSTCIADSKRRSHRRPGSWNSWKWCTPRWGRRSSTTRKKSRLSMNSWSNQRKKSTEIGRRKEQTLRIRWCSLLSTARTIGPESRVIIRAIVKEKNSATTRSKCRSSKGWPRPPLTHAARQIKTSTVGARNSDKCCADSRIVERWHTTVHKSFGRVEGTVCLTTATTDFDY